MASARSTMGQNVKNVISLAAISAKEDISKIKIKQYKMLKNFHPKDHKYLPLVVKFVSVWRKLILV